MGYPEKTINDYLEAIQSRTPTPGGGSVAALAGALGATLAQMVGVYTSGKKYVEVEARAKQIVTQAQTHLDVLRRAIDDDCAAYDTVLQAMRMPKETDAEKAARRDAMQKSFTVAMEVPFQTCRESLGLLRLLPELATIGNKNLASDVGVAALLAATAFEGAKMNVEINLGSIKDGERVATTREEVNAAHKEVIQLKNRVVAQVTGAIGLA